MLCAFAVVMMLGALDADARDGAQPVDGGAAHALGARDAAEREGAEPVDGGGVRAQGALDDSAREGAEPLDGGGVLAQGALDDSREGVTPGVAPAGGALDGGVAPGLPAKVTPILAPAYTKELGFIASAGVAVSWDGSPGSPRAPRSSLTAVVSYGTVGAFLSQVRLNTFWLDDRIRFSALIDVRDQPDEYFGVGLQRALRAAPSTYRKRSWQADPRVLLKLRGPLYAGLVLDVRGTLSRDVSAGMEADPSYQSRGGATALSSGVGFTLVWDSRDVPINAYRGWYLAADWVAYVPSPLGNSTWMAAGLDYRHAVTLGREGSTLTWQVRYRTAWGAVPWSDLPLVGTPFDLRAYRLGRFRDATSLVALVEYRWMMPFEPKPWWKLWTRLGFALWTGVGALGSTPLPDFSAVLPAAGVGLRVLIQDRVTLRLDFGVGRGSTAFYFQFLEAF